MSIIKQPSEIQEKKNLVMMVYGSPGTGKSTLAMSAPSPVLIDTDGGVGRTHTAHRVPTVQVTKWEDVQQAMDEIATLPSVKTVIVDTVGKLLDYMSEYITRTQPKMRKGYDGSLSLQGYGVRKGMFRDFIKRCMMSQKNVVFIAHAQEDKVDDSFVVRPIVGGSSMADIMATWIDKTITPVEMCAYAIKHGFRTKTSGTAWDFFKSIAGAYGYSKFVQTKSMATARTAIRAGA